MTECEKVMQVRFFNIDWDMTEDDSEETRFLDVLFVV